MRQAGRRERLRRYWDRHAGSYDKQMGFFDRHLFSGSRDWVCSRATGRVLEVAIGTGLNFAHYPEEVQLTGVDQSPAMLDIARRRAAGAQPVPDIGGDVPGLLQGLIGDGRCDPVGLAEVQGFTGNRQLQLCPSAGQVAGGVRLPGPRAAG